MTRPVQDELFKTGDEVAKLREEVKAAWAEHSALNDRYMRLLKEQGEREQGAREAAERRARDTALDLIGAALGETLADAAHLARAVLALPELPSLGAVLELRVLAVSLAERDVDARPDVAAIRAIEKRAQEQIDHWKGRSVEYWNRTKRSRQELIDAEDTYADLVSAGWKPPTWRLAQHRAAAEAERVRPTPAVQDSPAVEVTSDGA